ncbi:hypothetical protein COHA_001042 [Chlorella ohadii]|uniref:Peptidase M14 domain-containing protein n=1 Tax=Chlorella ohadii TaxID=2649997 RepID=A0AAD5H6B3_9CHLO|nr:hypothetical protein COHA_001042 [Chlorella ohadii]
MRLFRVDAMPWLLLAALLAASAAARPMPQLAEPDYTLYHTMDSVFKEVRQIVESCPATMKLSEESLTADGNYSSTLTVVTVEPAGLSDAHEDKLRLLLNFGEHGRELISSEIALHLLRLLCSGEAERGAFVDGFGLRRDHVQALLQRTVFKIVPMENIRGRARVEAGELCLRKNGRGVDPNRNWDYHWGEKEKDYDPNEEYPGTAPFSEPEAALLLRLAQGFKPHVWTSVHSGMAALFMPYDHQATIPDGEGPAALLEILKVINERTCNKKCAVGSGGKSVGYLAHGTATDYMYSKLGVPVSLTWEVYGDTKARFEDCFRMFNPLTQEVYTETVESWSASFFALLSLLPRHPDIQKELALPTAAAEGGQTGPAAGGGGSGGTAGTLGRRGGDAAQPNDGAAAGQQQQQADGAGGAAVREPAGVLAASSGAGGSGGEAAGSGDGGDGSSADKALEIASALREHMQQQDGGEAQQQGQQGGSAAAASGRGGLEPLAGGRPRSGVASAIYWLTLAALGCGLASYLWRQPRLTPMQLTAGLAKQTVAAGKADAGNGSAADAGKYDYDLFCIGAGSGGVRASRVAAGTYGAKVGICEMPYNPIASDEAGGAGGTCVLRGCVPKKLFVYASEYREMFSDAQGFGWQLPGQPTLDWQSFLAKKNAELQRLNGVYMNLLKNSGVDYIEGRGKLVDAHTVDVGGKRITARHILIATGARAFVPQFEGSEHCVISDNALEIQEVPKSIVIIGSGYIAVEFAGIFAGLGSEVHLVFRQPLPLRGFDEEVRKFAAEQYAQNGLHLHGLTTPEKLEKLPNGRLRFTGARRSGAQSADEETFEIETDVVLAATGRRPNVHNLGLEELGVKMTKGGAIDVDAYSQSSVPSVWAIGDVTDRMALTPVALMEAMALTKTIFAGQPTEPDHHNVPTAVFSHPQISTVGMSEEQAQAAYGNVDVYTSSFRPMRNTISGNAGRTFMKLLVAADTDVVVGCHMVGPDAAEIMQGLGVAVKMGITKAQLDSTVGIHPSAAEEFVTMRSVTRQLRKEEAKQDVSGAFQALQAACQGQLPLTTLAQQLEQLGSYRGLGRENAIAKFSRHVLDALPKILLGGAGPSAAEQALAEKVATHQLLLQCLSDCGAFQRLHASVLRCLLEDGQRLAVLTNVQQLESELARSGAPGALHGVVLAAGTACMAAVAGSGDRDAPTVFYSCPTATVTQFFQQLAAAAAALGRSPGRAAADQAAVAQLERGLGTAVESALAQRAQQQQFFPTAMNAAVAGSDEPELAAGADVRIALAALADACCRLQPLLEREAPQLLQASVQLLFNITDRLLNAGAAAVTAAAPGQQRRQLHDEYAALREKLLRHLLRQAAALCDTDEAEGAAQVGRLRSLAEGHSGWAALFDVADLTGERERLYGEMEQLRGDGLTPPLATYVFARLLAEGRRAELLDLPAQFDAELLHWLGDASGEDGPARQQLLWLHQLRMEQYGPASETLAALVAEEQEAAGEAAPRLVALQRLAALAAGDAQA